MQEVDLTQCDREPIHLLGAIQPEGCLVVVTSDWLIQYVSANTEQFLGSEAEDLLGTSLDALFETKTVHEIRNVSQQLFDESSSGRLFNLSINERALDLSVTRSNSGFLLEFEPSQKSSGHGHGAIVSRVVSQLKSSKDTQQLCLMAARMVKMFTGFDRVMIYRFLDDGTGEVIAESKTGSVESFLGLRYPATDIPKQARALYLRKLIRVIADVDSKPVPILPERGPYGEPCDLSDSLLRRVSDVHLQYLRNMGVSSSMSVSIIIDGELWGLIACHHSEAKFLALAERTSVELVGEMVALLIESQSRTDERKLDEEVRAHGSALIKEISSADDPVRALMAVSPSLMESMGADGVGFYFETEVYLEGDTPNQSDFSELIKFLNTTNAGEIFETDALSSVFRKANRFAPAGAGILVLPLTRTPRDYLVFFRNELSVHVDWAGNPDKAAIPATDSQTLSPRRSFAAWRQEIRGTSEPWHDREKALGESIRHHLLEVLLKQTDLLESERRAHSQQQELFIAELNHRIRNVLTLVRSLIGQTSSVSNSMEQFISSLDGRVNALARANDQMTRHNWGPGSVFKLIRSELDVYDNSGGRVDISGEDVGVFPDALSAMALVFHELATNAAKYGALSNEHGKVTVRVETLEMGDLKIRWEESGGPPVQRTKRVGFGSTVIERSIPHSLRGTASVELKLSGLSAEFTIPSKFIDLHCSATSEAQVTPPILEGESKQPLKGTVMLLEDNMIIAMGTEDHLYKLGADSVVIAANLSDAQLSLNTESLSFAVLDINLGPENSFGFADKLKEQGVPFIFLSGYADGGSMPTRFLSTPQLTKPYDLRTLGAKIASATKGQ